MKISNKQLKKIIQEEMESLYREAEDLHPVGITDAHLKKQSVYKRIEEARGQIELALNEISVEFVTKQHPDTDEETFQSTNRGNLELIRILSEADKILAKAPGLEMGKGY